MNMEQYEGIKALLEEIRDRMPVRDIPEDPVTVRRLDTSKAVPVFGTVRENLADKRQALAIFRAVLDDWIRGARENHEASGHRGENTGEECWRTFLAEDVRNMVNDAAQEMGLKEFPKPTRPEEDKR